MKRVAITGAAGYLGSALARALADVRDVEAIVGIDIRQPQQPAPQLHFYQKDITTPLAPIFTQEGVDTVVHLAFLLNPTRDRRLSRRVNVDGTANVLRASEEAGVKHLLFMSSATAYGAHRDNPTPLTEEAPLRPNSGMTYAQDKAQTDLMAQAFAREHTKMAVTILRACPVLGPTADNFVVRGLFRSAVYKVAGHDPPMQYLHEEDLLRLLLHCLRNRVAGTYNVAGEGTVPYSELARLSGKRLVSLPPGLLELLASLSWSLHLQSDGTAAGVAFIKYPWVASTEKLKREAGFSPRLSSRETLASLIASRKR